jgi:hypothetical protein
MIVSGEQIVGRLTHWVPNKYAPTVFVHGTKVMYHTEISNKPDGIWLSWENGWEDFCNNCGSTLTKRWVNPKKYTCFDAYIPKDIRIWLINSLDDFYEMWLEFIPDKEEALLSSRTFNQKETAFWEWLKVIKQIDGIALTKRGERETRYRTFLYGWDCSSLVIFKPEDVALRIKEKWVSDARNRTNGGNENG